MEKRPQGHVQSASRYANRTREGRWSQEAAVRQAGGCGASAGSGEVVSVPVCRVSWGGSRAGLRVRAGEGGRPSVSTIENSFFFTSRMKDLFIVK